MPDTRGVFGIFDVLVSKLEDERVPLSDVWVSPSPIPSPNTGYFGGGTPGSGQLSTMDKIFYTANTTIPVFTASLIVARTQTENCCCCISRI